MGEVVGGEGLGSDGCDVLKGGEEGVGGEEVGEVFEVEGDEV